MQNTAEIEDTRGIQANFLLGNYHDNSTNLQECLLLRQIMPNFHTKRNLFGTSSY